MLVLRCRPEVTFCALTPCRIASHTKLYVSSFSAKSRLRLNFLNNHYESGNNLNWMDSDGANNLMAMDIVIITDIFAVSGTLFYPRKFSSGYRYLRAVLLREKVAILHWFMALFQLSGQRHGELLNRLVCDSLGSSILHAPLLPRG